jgi:hypothetical protein
VTSLEINQGVFPSINIPECYDLYTQKRFDKLCEILFNYMRHFNEVCYASFSKTDIRSINDYVEFVFFIFTRTDFRMPDAWTPLFININHIFANLVALSAYGTTDGPLASLLGQEGNYCKLLFMYTCRNKSVVPIQDLIRINPALSTLWWNNFSVAPCGATSELINENMESHLKSFIPELYLTDIRVQPVYFQCSYHGLDERAIKEWQNKELRKFISKQQKIRCKPKRNRIAIITDKWQATTAVYKSLSPQIAELAKKYDLSLILSSRCDASTMEKSLFKRVISYKFDVQRPDLSSLDTSDFQLAYFPDVGMTDESTYLANTRLAPIMVCGYGHPVSTYGSLIDYFIGGQGSERADLYKENYSERLVLIPGLGAHPVDPKYTRKYPEADGVFRINCCWTSSKINWPMLKMLREIQLQSSIPIHYQFFPSWTGTRYNCYFIIQREMANIFDGNVTVHYNLKYQDYLTEMERASLTIDSHPFGGYNTVVDSLFVGCPVVTIEGTKFYNRASSALTRLAGVDFSTTSIEECKKQTLELINNPEKLLKARNLLDNVPRLEQLLLHTEEPQGFVKAIDYILKNHPVPGTEPIIIT